MKKWQLLKSDTIISTPWFNLLNNQYKTEKGEIVNDYYIVQRSNFVLIVAVNDGKLILVRQYRAATDQFYIALPAGYLHDGESPEVGAKRELLEETGFSATECRLIGELHPLPGYIQSTAFVVFCEASTKSIGIIDQLEIGEVLKVEWHEVIKMIAHGEINEMQAVSAILLAKEIVKNIAS